MRRFGSIGRPVLLARAGLLLLVTPALAASQAATQGSEEGAQPPPASPVSALLRDAQARLAAGDTSAALELLERATDRAPNDPDALYARSTLLLATTELGVNDALRQFIASRLLTRAASLEPRNPRHLLSLGRLRLRTPLLRVEAERMFRRALEVARSQGDPAMEAAVAWELAQVKERRYRTGANRWMYTGSVIFDPITAQRRLHYTREFLQNLSRPVPDAGATDRAEAEGYYRRALAVLPGHAPSVLGLAGLLYDHRRVEEMAALLRTAVGGEGAAVGAATDTALADSVAVRLRLAAGLAAWRLGQAPEAERHFADALASAPAATRDEWLDLGRILRVGDSVRVAGLPAAERTATMDAFWEAADPVLDTPENEARLEYLARIAWADLRFTDPDTRQVGWRTDRGLVAIRYGEPPVVATFAPQLETETRDALTRVLTVWFYPRTEMEFVFSSPPAFNLALFAGNYRDHAAERRDAGPFLLDNLPVAMAVDSLPVQVGRLRGTAPGRWQLVVGASLDGSALLGGAEVDAGSAVLTVRAGAPSQLRVRARDTVSVRAAAPPVRRQWTDTVSGDALRLRVEARDPAVNARVARAQVELAAIPAFRAFDPTGADTTSALAISDLLLVDRPATASRGTAGWRGWTDAGLRLRGDLALPSRDTVAVYWEGYGLRPDSAGRVRYDVQVTMRLVEIDRGGGVLGRTLGSLADALGMTAEGEDQVGVRFTRDEPLAGRDRIPDLLTLGLGEAPAGRYRLTVTLTDRLHGGTVRAERMFAIRRARP
jgi:GWxTD domain-containing protein